MKNVFICPENFYFLETKVDDKGTNGICLLISDSDTNQPTWNVIPLSSIMAINTNRYSIKIFNNKNEFILHTRLGKYIENNGYEYDVKWEYMNEIAKYDACVIMNMLVKQYNEYLEKVKYD